MNLVAVHNYGAQKLSLTNPYSLCNTMVTYHLTPLKYVTLEQTTQPLNKNTGVIRLY